MDVEAPVEAPATAPTPDPMPESTITSLALASVSMDPATQVRAALSEALITSYAERMQAGDGFPAIVVFYDGTTYHLADGFHRCHARLRVGLTNVIAEVRIGRQADALWYALAANRAHGQRLSLADKRHAIILALTAWGEHSNRQIADQIGCTDVYVSSVRRTVQATLHLPDYVIGRDGKRYPATAAHGQDGIQSPQRLAVTELVIAGKTSKEIRAATGAHTDLIAAVRREHGRGTIDRSRGAVEKRHEQMRTMAGGGHSAHQIAAVIGMSVERCRVTMKRLGITVIADQVTRGTHRHNANRIVGRIVMDAENLVIGANLVEFHTLDRALLTEWVMSLRKSRDALNAFIRRVTQEQPNGETA